jgi:Domain of unknown function (DUF4845)
MQTRLTAHRQRGVTAIGWVLLLTPIFILGYIAMRCITPYSNFMAVTRALNNFAKENEGNGAMERNVVKDYLSRKWETEYIYEPHLDDVQITKYNGGWRIEASYEQVVPVFYNISLLFNFEKTVEFK